MRDFDYRNHRGLITLLVVYLLLQVFDFSRPFNHPYLMGLAKFAVFTIGTVTALLTKINWRQRIVSLFVFWGLLYGSYYLHAWRLTANIYLNSVEEEYIAAYDIFQKNINISQLFYHENGDSLFYQTYLGKQPNLPAKKD